MGEAGMDTPPRAEDNASKVGTKLKKLAILQMNSDFNPQESRLGYPRPSFATLLTVVDDVRGAGLPTAPGRADGVERTVAMQRAEALFSLVDKLLPNTSHLNESLGKEGLEALFRDDAVTHDFRVADFLLDERTAIVLMRLPEPSFNRFMHQVESGDLPNCFSSDQEMDRLRPQSHSEGLRSDEYTGSVGNFDRAGTSIQSPPLRDSARQLFFEEAVVDSEERELRDDVNVEDTIATVSARFPQG